MDVIEHTQIKEKEQHFYCYLTFHNTVASSIMNITHTL